ncbi:MAG TPA: formate--tetrahydrofolate ligase [Herpetosiphonaceae bacterium]
MKTSLEIASEVQPQPMIKIAEQLGIPERYIEPYGRYKAKIDLDVLDAYRDRPSGKQILVTAITPTPLGEGKTATAIGLSMALNRLGKRAVGAIRQSSLGPVFGIKGGGAGGGYAQVIPLEASILHVTGDFHAITQAHNQIAAMTDNHWYHGNALQIDADRIQIRRVLDVNDRFLRNITIGQGGPRHGKPRQSGFDITAASELMAILALVSGTSEREALADLRARIGRVVVAFDTSGRPITADEIGAAGAATVIMRETLKPTLMQTIEHTPILLHGGPFGNIAHGNSSILADQVGLRMADYVVTEAGFGMDMGGEKFFDIKCRGFDARPAAVVLVATIRALKMHTGNYAIQPGKPLPPELLAENPDDVYAGGSNLRKQIENARLFGVPVVVAINRFVDDRPSEIAAVCELALQAGAADVAVSTVFAEGSAGGIELAEKVMAVAAQPSDTRFLYPLDLPIKAKIQTIAASIYGAAEVGYSEQADEQIATLESNGFGALPICMAKTHLSLSHDPALKGAPTGYVFPIREVRVSAGAGFIYPIAGAMMTMPGLSADPAALHIDIDERGNTIGLF